MIALQTTDPFSRQRGRIRKKNQVIVSQEKKSKIKSGQGSHREAQLQLQFLPFVSKVSEKLLLK
jgi:hypothetical protein